MWTPQEKVQCVIWLIESKWNTQVQRNCRTKFGNVPPSRLTIRAWNTSFMTTGSELIRKEQDDSEQVMKLLSGFEKHSSAVHKNQFVRLLHDYKYPGQQSTRCCTNGCVSMPVRYSCCRHCYQQTDQNVRNLP